VFLDTDTDVTETGAPLPTQRSATASSSYEIPIDIDYSGLIGSRITATVTGQSCISASGFSFDAPRGKKYENVASFNVDTGPDCFWQWASVSYNVSVDNNGPISLSLNQIGPRAFHSSCTDTWPIESKCQFLPQQRVYLHV
jgi:hypothetical protein